MFLRSTDGGNTFSAPVVAIGGVSVGTLAVGPEGEVYVAGGNGRRLPFGTSINAAAGTEIPSFVSYPDLVLGFYVPSTDSNPGGLIGQTWVSVDTSDGPYAGNIYLLTHTGLDPVLGVCPSNIP